MSLRTLLWAKDQTVITSNVRRKDGELMISKPTPNSLDKLILIAIGDEASEHAWDALIGIEDLAVFAGCTRRAVHDSLGRLERAGYVRCRRTKVESGQSGWLRIYLLSAESPLFQGKVEVDFGSIEQISRYQMRTFFDRHNSEFIPSDSLRNRGRQVIHNQDEPRSHCAEPSMNEVHTQGVNEVHTDHERGSYPGGERGSHPFFSTSGTSLPDPDGRTDPSDTENHQGKAVEITSQLNLAKVDAQPKQQRQVQQAIAKLLAAGFEHGVVARHAESKVREANTCTYLLNGLQAEQVPVAMPPVPASDAVVPTEWCGQCDREGERNPRARRVEGADGRLARCPRCHPDIVAAS